LYLVYTHIIKIKVKLIGNEIIDLDTDL